MSRVVICLALCVVTFATFGSAATTEINQRQRATGDTSQDWCRDADSWNDRDEVFCEVRTLTESGQSSLSANVANGSLTVTGSSRRDVSVQARIVARAGSMADARELAGDVRVTLERGVLRADGPRNSGWRENRNWHVSYRVDVPSRYDLSLEAANGAISVTDVQGDISAETANGSIRLNDLGGDVRARTSNGSTHATLSGSRWEGRGLSMVTANGSARVDIPSSYNARLVAATNNGGMNVDFPITVQGRIGRNLDTNIGSGGPTIEVRTSNGAVRIGRR